MRNYSKKTGALLIVLTMVMSLFGGITTASAEGLTQVFLQDFSNTNIAKTGYDDDYATYTHYNTSGNTDRGDITVSQEKLVLSADVTQGSPGYHLGVKANSVSDWNSGEGTSNLSVKFQMDANTDYIAFGGEVLTTDAETAIVEATQSGDVYVSEVANDWGRYRGGTNSQSYLQIYPNKIIVFDKTYNNLIVSTGTEHTIDLYVYGDNTFSLYLDETEIAKDTAMEKFVVRYNYYAGANNTKQRNVTLTDASYFRGFYEVYLMHYAKKDGNCLDSTATFDDLKISTGSGKHYLGSSVGEVTEKDIFSVDFTGFTGAASSIAVTPSVSGVIDSNIRPNHAFTAVTNPFNDADRSGDTALYINETVENTIGSSSFMSVAVNKYSGYTSGLSGSSVLTYDFAFDQYGTEINLQGEVVTEEYTIEAAKYSSGKVQFGNSANIVSISPTGVTACGNTVNFFEEEDKLATQKWHRAILVINGDNTFSLSIDNKMIFPAGTPLKGFKVRYANSTFYETNCKFLGFNSLWFCHSAKADGLARGSYYDNISLLAKYDTKYVDTAVDNTDKYVKEAAEELTLYTGDITNGIPLDTFGLFDSTITWKSSNPDAVSDYGKVFPKVGQAQSATLTATLTHGIHTATRTFDITVPAVMPYEITGIKVTGNDNIIDNALVGGKTISKISVKRNVETASELTVITAFYNGTTLSKVKSEKITPSIEKYAFGDLTLTNPLTLPEDVTNCKVKIMLLDSFGKLVAQSESYDAAPIKDSGITVYMAGDSIMKSYAATQYPQQGWGEMFKTFFNSNVTVDNTQPEGGRSSKSFIAEGRLSNIAQRIQPGDYLVVMFGHNDVAGGTKETGMQEIPWVNRTTTIDENYGSYYEYLEVYVDTAKAKGANVIICSSFNNYKADNSSFNGFIAATKKFAEEKNVPYLDMNTRSLELYKELEPDTSIENLFMFVKENDGRYGDDIGSDFDGKLPTSDGTHFNEYGAKVYAQLAAKELAQIGHPLSRYVDETKFFDVIEKMPTPLWTE